MLLAIGEHPREPQPRDHRELGVVAVLHHEAQLLGRGVGRGDDLGARHEQSRLMRVGVVRELGCACRANRVAASAVSPSSVLP